MKKEEILQKSKMENKNGDEKNLLDKQKSYAIGGVVAASLCLIFSMIESAVFKRSDTALWLVYTGTYFVVSLVGIIKSKQKWLVVPLICCAVGFVALMVNYCLGK